MAFVIGDACVACGACEAQCPVGAISMGDGKFEIDADKCVCFRNIYAIFPTRQCCGRNSRIFRYLIRRFVRFIQ